MLSQEAEKIGCDYRGYFEKINKFIQYYLKQQKGAGRKKGLLQKRP